MLIAAKDLNGQVIPKIREGWAKYRNTILQVSVALLALAAALRIGDETRRLLFDASDSSAPDLKHYQTMVTRCFTDRPTYVDALCAQYPPASLLMMLPFVGWLNFDAARWLWAATIVVALAALVYLIMRESGASTRLERTFVALMFLSMNATGFTIGNGQLGLHVLPPLLFGLLWLQRRRDLFSDLAAAVWIVASLLKPSIALPFLWVALFLPNRIRPLIFISLIYLALTLYALHLYPESPLQVVAETVARRAITAPRVGYANLTNWLANLGLPNWTLAANLFAISGLGAWVYWYRRKDVWLVLGVTALTARMWIYHSGYDDILLVVPMVALYQIAKKESENQRGIVAGTLLAITIAVMLFPQRWEIAPSPWYLIFIGGHTLVWLADLVFLLVYARNEQSPLEVAL